MTDLLLHVVLRVEGVEQALDLRDALERARIDHKAVSVLISTDEDWVPKETTVSVERPVGYEQVLD